MATHSDSGSIGRPGRVEIPGDALVLLVGAAGSGKSTFAGAHFAADLILSSDALREQVSGDPANQAASPRAFRILHGQVARRLAAGRLCVVDATNIATAARRPLRRLAAANGRPAIAFVLDLPAAICLERNAARIDRVVPEAVVLRQLGNLRQAIDGRQLVAEGFDRLVVLADPAAIEGTTVVLTRPIGTATLSLAASPRRGRRPNP